MDEVHTFTTSFNINYLSKDPISKNSHSGSWGFKIGVFGEHSSVPNTAPIEKFQGTQTSLVRESILWMAGLCSEVPQAQTLTASRCPTSAGSVDPDSWSLLCSGTQQKNNLVSAVLIFPVWLFIISSDFNNDLSLRWERIMNHSFTFKTLIKKAQFCFHELH